MKKSIIYLISMLFLCGCKATGTDNIKNNAITIINEVEDADIWILPKTEENLKTTVWGKATVSEVKINETRKAPLCEAGENGLYIIRLIDSNKIFYSADDVVLKSGWTVRITGDDLQSVKLEVVDESGVLKNTYDVFAASL